jgi:hypothetical protein
MSVSSDLGTWGPMAWFRIKEPESATGNNHQNLTACELQTDLPSDATLSARNGNAKELL